MTKNGANTSEHGTEAITVSKNGVEKGKRGR